MSPVKVFATRIKIFGQQKVCLIVCLIVSPCVQWFWYLTCCTKIAMSWKLRRINCWPVKQTDSSQQTQLGTQPRKNWFGFCNSRKGLKENMSCKVRSFQELEGKQHWTIGVHCQASLLKEGGRERVMPSFPAIRGFAHVPKILFSFPFWSLKVSLRIHKALPISLLISHSHSYQRIWYDVTGSQSVPVCHSFWAPF